jgi:hypothetical protein
MILYFLQGGLVNHFPADIFLLFETNLLLVALCHYVSPSPYFALILLTYPDPPTDLILQVLNVSFGLDTLQIVTVVIIITAKVIWLMDFTR